MKKQTVLLSALLLACGILAYSVSPSLARVVNRSVWTAELKPPSSGTAESEIFVSGGQTVIIKPNAEKKYEIPIDINTEEIPSFTAKGSGFGAALSLDGKSVILTGQTAADTTEVTLKYSFGEFSAVFKAAEEYSGDTVGSLAVFPEHYDKNVPMKLVAGSKTVIVTLAGGEFPPKTCYKTEETTVYLYNGGKIEIAPGKECYLDISKTGLEGDITISTGNQVINLKSVAAPVLTEDKTLVIKDTQICELPLDYYYGGNTPEIQIFKLVKNEKGLEWVETSGVAKGISENRKVLISPNGAPPATYKAVITWFETYSVEKVFYIQSDVIDSESKLSGGLANE